MNKKIKEIKNRVNGKNKPKKKIKSSKMEVVNKNGNRNSRGRVQGYLKALGKAGL